MFLATRCARIARRGDSETRDRTPEGATPSLESPWEGVEPEGFGLFPVS